MKGRIVVEAVKVCFVHIRESGVCVCIVGVLTSSVDDWRLTPAIF